jgi:hypothetical protein
MMSTMCTSSQDLGQGTFAHIGPTSATLLCNSAGGTFGGPPTSVGCIDRPRSLSAGLDETPMISPLEHLRLLGPRGNNDCWLVTPPDDRSLANIVPGLQESGRRIHVKWRFMQFCVATIIIKIYYLRCSANAGQSVLSPYSHLQKGSQKATGEDKPTSGLWNIILSLHKYCLHPTGHRQCLAVSRPAETPH